MFLVDQENTSFCVQKGLESKAAAIASCLFNVSLVLRIHIYVIENIELSYHKENEGSLGKRQNTVYLILSTRILCRLSF